MGRSARQSSGEWQVPESFTKSTVMSPFAFIVKCVRTETLSTGPPEAPRISKKLRLGEVALGVREVPTKPGGAGEVVDLAVTAVAECHPAGRHRPRDVEATGRVGGLVEEEHGVAAGNRVVGPVGAGEHRTSDIDLGHLARARGGHLGTAEHDGEEGGERGGQDAGPPETRADGHVPTPNRRLARAPFAARS